MCFVRGDKDISEVNSLSLCREIGIPIRIVPDSGHLHVLDNPDCFYGIIGNFLSS
jgi:hypothetical protein